MRTCRPECLLLLLALALCTAGCDDDDQRSPTATPTATAAATATATFTASATPSPIPARDWASYGHDRSRTFFNPDETRINRVTAASLRPKWRYLTGAIVTAAPTVAYVDVPGEGRIKVVFIASWDGHLYALRAANGSKLWAFAMKPHPGGSYPQASSAEVATVAGEQRVYVGGGMTVYCLAAASGELRWQFDAGTGCTDCGADTERNEIESSPTVVDGMVVFGMDVNDSDPGKGGAYAVDAEDGHLLWYFDLETAATCRPFAGDRIHRFDGFHSSEALGLAADFFSTRPGCDFDRTSTGCGNVWSSFAVDEQRRLLYSASSNCDTDDDPETVDPPPPMPPYDEALFALNFDGTPAWRWRPREVDNFDLAFGAVPNLFEATIAGERRAVVGIGNKDGTYYVLDRDGVNEISARIEPYWQRNVVAGGPIGGLIASAAVGNGQVFFTTAIGVSLNQTQKPTAHSLRSDDGSIVWQQRSAPPSYGPTTATSELMFGGGIFPTANIYDALNGRLLATLPIGQPGASAATVVEGEVFVGAGVGERGNTPDDAAYQSSLVPSWVSAFCLPDAPDCPESLCDDGDPCTYDFHGESGCESESAPDGIACGTSPLVGICRQGRCETAAP